MHTEKNKHPQILYTHNTNTIVCTPPFRWVRGVEAPAKFSKKGGLTGSQLEGGCWEKGGDFFKI